MGSNDFEAFLDDRTDGKDYISVLPRSIKRRIQALKKLQIDGINIEAQFYERVHQLEAEFAPMFNALHEKRRAIVMGTHEPTDEEADFPILHSCTEDEIKQMEFATAPEPAQPTKGIPRFWLHLLKSADHVGEMVMEHDEPILQHLIDITCDVDTTPDSYTLTFHFEPNDYFYQTQLKKRYMLQIGPNPDEIFEYDGPITVGAKGTEIKWKEGKNVTQKIVKKKEQKKTRNASRFITKSVKTDSFFNFFDTPFTNKRIGTNDSELDPEERELLQADFEIGLVFRDQIIPRAVLFYTKEAVNDNFMSFDDAEDEDEVEEEIDDEIDTTGDESDRND
ncbi:unnamed protein product [Thelazia callipaeda]|uniref:Nucleosome assembly protein 1-like 1 n=1 Tax=Thelazia callipaeda TaxID=103827 RepID=A0A0N5D5Q1_THECL|nr:unnamed protein product [Thelazia callipaeda]